MSERQSDTAQFKMDLDRYITRSDELLWATEGLSAGRHRRDAGMQQAASHRKEALIAAKAIARSICHLKGVVCIDDVLEELEKLNISAGELGPASGCIFRGDCWEFTGTWVPSRRVTNHARPVRLWRFKQ